MSSEEDFEARICRINGYFDATNDALCPPGHAANLLGVDPSLLRDWRRKGHLEGVGQISDKGRSAYSRNDVLIMARAKRSFDLRVVSLGDCVRQVRAAFRDSTENTEAEHAN